MSHPFGDLLTQFLHRKHGSSQSKLAAGILQPPSVITEMCQGKRLNGPQARGRVVAILGWLYEQGTLTTLHEANALLNAAGMAALSEHDLDEVGWIEKLTDGRTQSITQTASLARQSIPRNNLPSSLTRFIGRQHELFEIKSLIEGHRLVTLIGSGGVGKTRLAIEVGSGLLDQFADGVWLAEFAPVSDAELMQQVVMSVLSLSDQPGHSFMQVLIAYLSDKRLLLLLDNCEHVIGACATMTERLLSACPGLHILTTSREALNISGEKIWRVPSLAIPGPDAQPSPVAMLNYEAIALFIDHAIAAQPSFALNAVNGPAIYQICRQLDGIPLAIEMAAARVAALSVGEITADLEKHFGLQWSGRRTALPRQRTLRATLDWSYALLSFDAQALLAQLSVFVGGWTIEAAQAVCADPKSDVLTSLLRLVDASLVSADLAGHPSPMSTTRYHLLEIVRQYAAEKLRERDQREIDLVHDQHLAYFLQLTEIRQDQNDLERREWRLKLGREMGNLRAAFAWACQRAHVDQGESALRLAAAATPLQLNYGYVTECRQWLDQALALGSNGSPSAQATALKAKAEVLMMNLGDLPGAFPLIKTSLALMSELDDYRELGRTLLLRGELAVGYELDLDGGLEYTEAALTTFERCNSTKGIAEAQGLIGVWRSMLGQLREAESLLEQSICVALDAGCFDIAGARLTKLALLNPIRAHELLEQLLARVRQINDPELLSNACEISTVMYLGEGDYTRAVQAGQEGLEMIYHDRQEPLPWYNIISLHLKSGAAEFHLAHHDRATQHFEALMRAARESQIESSFALASCHYYWAYIALSRNDLAEAAHQSQKGLNYAHASGQDMMMVVLLTQQSDLAYHAGDIVRAGQLFGAAMARRDDAYWLLWSFFRYEYHTILDANQYRLSDAIFAAAAAEGRTMSLPQAMTYALRA